MPSPKELPLPWTLSGMDERNNRFKARFAGFLDRVIADDALHVRFLNTLSLLEHMGSRKIMLSQMNHVLTMEILKHLAEEARHAFFFKRHGERIGKTTLDGYTEGNTLARAPSAFYFSRLDSGIEKKTAPVQHAEETYLWVSLIVELRACWVYHLYQERLEAASSSLSLRSIIAEEDGHMADMFARLEEIGADARGRIQALSVYETGLFEKLFAQLEASVSASMPSSRAAA